MASVLEGIVRGLKRARGDLAVKHAADRIVAELRARPVATNGDATRPVELSELGSVWAKSQTDDLLRDQSHWRGVGRFADDEAWRSIGRTTVSELGRVLRELEQPPLAAQPRRVLEWGPGGGSNVVALLEAGCASVVGVDVSRPNLEECQRQADGVAPGRFESWHYSGEPTEIVGWASEPFDIFVSTAVFQHFPDAQYGYRVLASVKDLLVAGGIGVIQIRYENPRADGGADYRDNYIYRSIYPISDFWYALRASGLEPLAVRNLLPGPRYATFTFRRP